MAAGGLAATGVKKCQCSLQEPGLKRARVYSTEVGWEGWEVTGRKSVWSCGNKLCSRAKPKGSTPNL